MVTRLFDQHKPRIGGVAERPVWPWTRRVGMAAISGAIRSQAQIVGNDETHVYADL